MELYVITLVCNRNLDYLGYGYLWRLTCNLIHGDGNAAVLNVSPVANDLFVELKFISRNYNSSISDGRSLIRLNISDSTRCIVVIRYMIVTPILVIPLASV
jgi:hypothetical protein